MKSLALLLAIPISLLVFCFCPTTVLAEMISALDLEGGYYSPTSIPRPNNDAANGPHPAEVDSNTFSYQLGPVLLGVGAKTYGPDNFSKSGDAKLDRIVIFNLGFHF